MSTSALKAVGKYQCMHGCNQIFKSRKQKILHHNKLDRECREEKYRLLELLEVFQKAIVKSKQEYSDKGVFCFSRAGEKNKTNSDRLRSV